MYYYHLIFENSFRNSIKEVKFCEYSFFDDVRESVIKLLTSLDEDKKPGYDMVDREILAIESNKCSQTYMVDDLGRGSIVVSSEYTYEGNWPFRNKLSTFVKEQNRKNKIETLLKE